MWDFESGQIRGHWLVLFLWGRWVMEYVLKFHWCFFLSFGSFCPFLLKVMHITWLLEVVLLSTTGTTFEQFFRTRASAASWQTTLKTWGWSASRDPKGWRRKGGQSLERMCESGVNCVYETKPFFNIQGHSNWALPCVSNSRSGNVHENEDPRMFKRFRSNFSLKLSSLKHWDSLLAAAWGVITPWFKSITLVGWKEKDSTNGNFQVNRD